MAKFSSIQDVTDALARGEINSAEANEAILKLTQATLRIETGPKGTGVVKLSGRSFPLASLYADEWETLLDPENVEKILTYVGNSANGVKRKTKR
jgi:hypothetical protein